jgi:putative transposase
MKKSRYSESQIISILKEAENSVSVADLCRKHGMSDASLYNWRAKYGGMDVSMVKRMKELEAENRRLKKVMEANRGELKRLKALPFAQPYDSLVLWYNLCEEAGGDKILTMGQF